MSILSSSSIDRGVTMSRGDLDDLKEAEVAVPMTNKEIIAWKPELDMILKELNEEHTDYLNWLQQLCANREKWNGGVISIYAETYGDGERMFCNICREFEYIANKTESECVMARGCEFDVGIMKDHFQSVAHSRVLHFILMNQYKDRSLGHAFGGSDYIVTKLSEIIEKMVMEQVDEKIAAADDVLPHKHVLILRKTKPPLYPFDNKCINKIKKRLGEALAFSIDQTEFVGEVIRHSIHYPTQISNDFNLIADINAIPSILSDLPFVNNVLQVIAITQPIIMKRLFQALMMESEHHHTHNKEQRNQNIQQHDMKHIQELFESALKTTKMTIMDDINHIKRTTLSDDKDSSSLFENRRNNINVNNWKFKNLDLSLLFDIYSIYRMDQFVNDGTFDTTPADLRERCGGSKKRLTDDPIVDNDINMDEATMFQGAIRYYMNNIVRPIELHKSWVVNGDVMDCMAYVFALSSYLKELIATHEHKKNYNIGALQFDLVLMVESMNVCTRYCSNDLQLDIAHCLDLCGLCFVKREIPSEQLVCIDRNEIEREIKKAMECLLIKLKIDTDLNKTAYYNKRFVVLVDLLHHKHTLYIFEGILAEYDNIGLDNDSIMHYFSQRYLVPRNDKTWIGGAESQNGQLFTYSFHIHAVNIHRCYLYYNGGCTRTFPEHFTSFIPKYFVYPKHRFDEKKDFKKEFIKLLYSHDYKHGFDLVLNDDAFSKMYRQITGLFHITVNYRRIKVMSMESIRMASTKSIESVFGGAHKALKDLNKEEFCFILSWCLKQQQIEVDAMKLKHAVINELKLDGKAFMEISRKHFGKGMKQIGIVGGKASKLYKQIKEQLNGDKIMDILADFKPQDLPKNKVHKEESAENGSAPPNTSPKSISELNVQQMLYVILHCMDKMCVECNLQDLENLVKKDMKLDGALFAAMGRKEFGKKMKSIGIKSGKCGKLFKELKQKITMDQVNDILRKTQSLEKTDASVKPLEALTAQQVNAVLFEIITSDDKLNNANINMDKVKEITIKNDLNGAKCKAMKRKEFIKIYKESGMKGGHSSQLFLKLNKMQPDEIAIYLKLFDKDDGDGDGDDDDGHDDDEKKDHIEEITLESLNVEQFRNVFISILKEKNIENDEAKLEQCHSIITEQRIDGALCKRTKALKFAKLFKIVGIKSGPLAKAHKTIIHLDVAEIGRKLLIPPQCNGKLEECPNVEELCRILGLFHNKSVEQLMAIHLNITETVKIINHYNHLTSRHNLFGDIVHDLPQVRDENAEDPKDLSSADQYRTFQHKVFELLTSRIGHCNSDGRNCYFILRHSRDVELAESAENVIPNAMLLDTIASIHTFIFHNVENQLYRLYDREAAQEGLDGYGEDNTMVYVDYEDAEKKKETKEQRERPRQKQRNYKMSGHQVQFLKSSPDDQDESDEEREEGVPQSDSRRPRRMCERYSTAVDTRESQSKIKIKIAANTHVHAPVLLPNLSNLHSKPKLKFISSLKQKSSLALLAHHQALSSSIKINLANVAIDKYKDNYNEELSNKFSTALVSGKNNKNEINAINFGEKLDDWFSPLESPLFKSVYEEVTSNEFEKIFEETYDEIKKKCGVLLQSQSNDEMLFSLEELIAVKLYTDCDKLQSRFRRTFWSTSPKRQKQSFFHWALMLQKTVTYGAKPITFDVFHGLSNLFTVKKMLPIFHGPISTTTSANVATKFADTKGMLWRIQPRIWSELENPIGIKVHWISRFEYEKEVLLMNCPLPIRKTKAFETGIHKKIEYLLDYLSKYNEPITDKKKFYTQVGLDKLVTDKYMGSELERLWLCDLGKSPNLWKISKRSVPRLKLIQWLNEEKTLSEEYWTQYVKKKVQIAKHAFFQKMQKIEEQIAEDQKVYCYGYVIKKLFEDQRKGNQIQIKKLKQQYKTTSDPKEQTNYESRIKKLQKQIEYNTVDRSGAIKIVSMLRALPTSAIRDTDPAIAFFRGKYAAEVYTFLTRYIDALQFERFKLNYSVYYRLINELDMFYLPFAAFTRVVYNGPFISRQDRIDWEDNEERKESEYTKRHSDQSNLFKQGRYATIIHLEEGIPLLQEMTAKHKIRYRLQFRFRPDKQSNLKNLKINYESLQHHFDTLELHGRRLNRIKNDEFELISLSIKLSADMIPPIPPSEIMKVFEEIVHGDYDNEAYDDDKLNKMSHHDLWLIFSDKMKRNERERKIRKERRKSEKYSWMFVDIDVDKIKKEMIYLNIAGCANYEVLNHENIWNYKLMCCVIDEDPDKWICIDKGRYRVDLDCVVPADQSVEIDSFTAMPRNKNKLKGFHRNVWVFRSLHLKENSRLSIKPFGYNFINQGITEEKDNDKDNDDDLFGDYDKTDNKDFMFGSIRIFCYDSIVIEEGATISVTGKGMYGSAQTSEINIGRGGHIEWNNCNSKDKNKNKNKNKNKTTKSVVIYSGGGYGSQGKDVVDEAKQDINDNDGRILSGGDVYGEKELDTLYYGSSGGRGCVPSNKASYYAVSDRGGGIIELIAQSIENKGMISANGKCGKPGGAWCSSGSGGSVKIKCKQFKHSGDIEATGGKLPRTANTNTIQNGKTIIDKNYQPLHSSGGNGRIAIYYNEGDLNGKSVVNPKAYIDSIDKCNKSKLPLWKRPPL